MFCKARKSDSQNAQMVKKMLEKKRRAMKTILNLTIKQLYVKQCVLAPEQIDKTMEEIKSTKIEQVCMDICYIIQVATFKSGVQKIQGDL